MIHIAIVEADIIWKSSLQELFEFVPNFSVDYTSDDYVHSMNILGKEFEGIIVVGASATSDRQLTRETIKNLAGANQNNKLFVISNESDITFIVELLNFGISGFALKKPPISQYIGAIEDIASGGAYLSPSVAAKLVSLFKKKYNSELSEREVEVLGHMAKGKSYSSIAEDLYISKTTVKAHMRNIYSKLQVNDKASAIKKAYSQKILISLI